MSATAVPVAVVGVGHLGRIHAKIYAESELSDLVAVVDRDPERAASVAAEFGCRVVKDLAELPGLVKAVSVAVPTPIHAQVAVPLLEAGVACLVEKPLAGNVAEADAIVAASRASGASLAVGHVERFQPGLRRVRSMRLKPKFIECHRLTAFSFRSMDVGVVHDLMIHDLDLVLDLVDSEVTEVDAVGGRILTDHEDVASVRLVFKNGARANVTANRVSLSPMRRFRMFSSSSYVSLDFTKNYGLVVRKGERWDAERDSLAGLDPSELAAQGDMLEAGLLEMEELELGGEQRPLQAELAAFLASVADGTPPEVGGEEGSRALALADDIVARIREQAW